jgi:hypothetical protein
LQLNYTEINSYIKYIIMQLISITAAVLYYE